jgi:cysteine desulfurase
MKSPVYLDYAATTPVDAQVAAIMSAVLVDAQSFGNPSSTLHPFGRQAAGIVARGRAQVATVIGADAREIVFTSGATESDNLAIIGAARFRQSLGKHIITSVTEHPAVLEACRYLENDGFRLTYLQPNDGGIITPQSVADALTPETILVSIMHVNNEIGVLQDIASIGEICRGANVLLHVDAAQSAGREEIDVSQLPVDLMSLSAQKLYGPKGIGALYINRDRVGRIEPLFFGGGQERGLRPGTHPTHQIAGMGEAYAIALQRRAADSVHLKLVWQRMWSALQDIPGVLLNGDLVNRSFHILSVSVTGVEGESLHYALHDIAVSAGSACATASDAPSAVLRALGRSDQLARSSVRFSFGRQTTDAQIDFAVERFGKAVTRLRALAPASAVALA